MSKTQKYEQNSYLRVLLIRMSKTHMYEQDSRVWAPRADLTKAAIWYVLFCFSRRTNTIDTQWRGEGWGNRFASSSSHCLLKFSWLIKQSRLVIGRCPPIRKCAAVMYTLTPPPFFFQHFSLGRQLVCRIWGVEGGRSYFFFVLKIPSWYHIMRTTETESTFHVKT